MRVKTLGNFLEATEPLQLMVCAIWFHMGTILVMFDPLRNATYTLGTPTLFNVAFKINIGSKSNNNPSKIQW
jgi:hypothetical protein